jgi:hypothetical protein
MIERELTNLFGADVLQDCWELPTVIEPGQAIKIGMLSRLLIAANSPDKQRKTIQSMKPEYQLLLCRWLVDRDYADKCIGAGK